MTEPSLMCKAARPRSGDDRTHLLALDGVRGLAILLVLLVHAADPNLHPFRGFRSILGNVVCSSGYGVQLFFVLSGFLITGILLDSKGTPHYFKFFYARRILRIFPLYYGTLLVFSACVLIFGIKDEHLFFKRLPWLLTYTSNIVITARRNWSFIFDGHSLGHFWSLAVEEQFYLVWPMIILWCSPRTIKRLCFVAIPVGLLSRTMLAWPGNNILGALVFLPCHVDSLALGALLAVMVRENEPAVAKWAQPAMLMGCVGWLVSCVDMKVLVTYGMSGFILMSAGLLAAALYNRTLSLLFSNRMLRSFGKYSYAIYILHVLLLPFILPLKARFGLPVFALLFIALSYCAGWLSWHVVEVHFLRLKTLFPADKGHSWRPRLSPQAGARIF